MDVRKRKNHLKIAILAPITWRVPPRAYGPWERVVYNLVEQLVKLGQKVTLFATGNSKTSAKLEAVIEKPLGQAPQPNPKLWESLHVSSLFEKAGTFDLIHNHLNYLPLTYSSLVKKPILTTLHGAAAYKQTHPVFLKYKNSNYVSISNFERSYLPSLNYLTTIYNGVDFNSFPLSSKPKNYLVYTGRLVREKGVLEAIKLAKKIKVKLLLAGIVPPDQNSKKFFKAKIKPLIDGKQIKFLGNLSQKKLAKLVSQALAYLFLIKKENKGEACPLAALEALACGVPIIGTHNGPLPELIKPGVNGVLIDSLEEAAEKIAVIRKLERKKIKYLAKEKFSQEKMAKEYLKCYHRIIEEKENND